MCFSKAVEYFLLIDKIVLYVVNKVNTVLYNLRHDIQKLLSYRKHRSVSENCRYSMQNLPYKFF